MKLCNYGKKKPYQQEQREVEQSPVVGEVTGRAQEGVGVPVDPSTHTHHC